MKNVRIWYTKNGACRYISHLDVNRAMTRALQMSGIPLWHTEGFNSRLYVSFALPLSLGFCGTYESVDIKLLKDDYSFDEVKTKLNECLPVGLCVFDVTVPIMKPADIAYARFVIKLAAEEHSSEEILAAANSLLGREQILVGKKTKKGTVKQVDLKESIADYTVEQSLDGVTLNITLPAGNSANINPTLLTDALEKECGFELFLDITRNELFDESFKLFR